MKDELWRRILNMRQSIQKQLTRKAMKNFATIVVICITLAGCTHARPPFHADAQAIDWATCHGAIDPGNEHAALQVVQCRTFGGEETFIFAAPPAREEKIAVQPPEDVIKEVSFIRDCAGCHGTHPKSGWCGR